MAKTYELPLFPLNTVLFPGMILPLYIFEERYKKLIRLCISDSLPFGVVLLRSGRAEGNINQDFYDVGTTARITQVNTLSDERYQILTLGIQRFRVHSTHNLRSYITGIVEAFPLVDNDVYKTTRSAKKIAILLKRYLEIFKNVGELDLDLDQLPDDPITLAFLTAIILPISNEDKQRLLSVIDVNSFLQDENELLRHELLFLKILTENRPAWPDGLTFSPN